MYRIVCVTPHPVVAFAADELKKYLKMMMPRRGEIAVCLRPDEAENPEGKSGNGAFGAVTGMDVFRLGILSDFGLDPCRVEDDRLDDVLYADADFSNVTLASLPVTGAMQNSYIIRFTNIGEFLDGQPHLVKITILSPDGKTKAERTFYVTFGTV